MDRRAFLGALWLLAWPVGAEAQQAAKIYRVGVLANKPRTRQKLICGKRGGSACRNADGSRAETW